MITEPGISWYWNLITISHVDSRPSVGFIVQFITRMMQVSGDLGVLPTHATGYTTWAWCAFVREVVNLIGDADSTHKYK